MKKTLVELFAGVGGFRCGLNNINVVEDAKKEEKWDTVWFSQWEPAEKNTQYAHDCYVYHFGTCLDKNGNDTTNVNIEEVDKSTIPDFNLLVGGFPCQDYSVASSLATSKGLEGKKGVLWWSIRDILEEKKPPFVLLENVDRLIKSPAKQRGRDFGIILACFRDEGYTVEWRVINAAEYGYQQRRRRIFIFAYKNDTQYTATFFEANGNPLVDQKIPIFINNGNYSRTTNSNGTIIFPINLAAGNYTITVANPVTRETASNNVTVLPTLKANDVVKTYRNDTQYEALVLDGQGKALANTVVTFNINGVLYNRTSKANGIAKLNINLEPKDYIITAEYKCLKTSNKIKVLSVLKTNDLNMFYKDGSKFTATLLDGQGNPYQNRQITFNINGVFYNRTTDSNGLASLSINLMSGEYIITSSYSSLNVANRITIS